MTNARLVYISRSLMPTLVSSIGDDVDDSFCRPNDRLAAVLVKAGEAEVDLESVWWLILALFATEKQCQITSAAYSVALLGSFPQE